MNQLYPRLGKAAALKELQRIEQSLRDGTPPRSLVDLEFHPAATFPAEGTPIPASRLRALREHVISATQSSDRRPNADHNRRFDLEVGRALATWFEREGRSQAAHPDVWPYISLVVLPDLAMTRFPPDGRGNLAIARFSAGRRNVFQRLYLRSWIIGDLLDDPELQLYEDDLVGLIDRNLSSDHRLARLVSEQIARVGSDRPRRDVVRSAFKSVQFELRVTDLAALPDDRLRDLLGRMFGNQ